jgi:hypothetical protein
MPPNTVYVGRPSRWGNPFEPGQTLVNDLEVDPSGRTIDQRLAVIGYRFHAANCLRDDSEWLVPLRGKDLACWCSLDQPCHADVLLELANR